MQERSSLKMSVNNSQEELDVNRLEQSLMSKQPLSLVTIRTKQTLDGASSRVQQQAATVDDGQLLTLRVIEASEKKMQLLRQLLTPEQFESLPFRQQDEWKASLFKQIGSQSELQQLSEPSENFDRDSGHSVLGFDYRDRIKRRYKSTNSEPNLMRPNLRLSDGNRQLAPSHEAIDFFLYPSQSLQASSTPSLELRSGYYLTGESDIIQPQKCDFSERIQGFMGLLGYDAVSETDPTRDLPQLSLGLVAKDNLPYSRLSNRKKLRARLEADGQLEKVLALERSESNYNLSGPRDLLQLARSQFSSQTSNTPTRRSIINETLRNGNFNYLAQKPRPPNKANFIKDCDILLSTPNRNIIEHQLLSMIEKPVKLNRLDDYTLKCYDCIKLNLLKLSFVCHPLMIDEEKLAQKLSTIWQQIQTKRIQELDVIKKNISKCIELPPGKKLDIHNETKFDYHSKNDSSSRSEMLLEEELRKLKSCIEGLTNLHDQALAMDQEIKNLRSTQKFYSTRCMLISSADAPSESKLTVESSSQNLTLLLDDITKRPACSDTTKRLANSCSDLSRLHLRRLDALEFKPDALGAEAHIPWPKSETARRDQLHSLFSSLSLEVRLGDRIYKETFHPIPRTHEGDLFDLDLRPMSVTVPIDEWQLSQCREQIELIARLKGRLFYHLPISVILSEASGKFSFQTIRDGATRRVILSPSSEHQPKIPLVPQTSFSIDLDVCLNRNERGSHPRWLDGYAVGTLENSIFARVCSLEDRFGSRADKLSRILNRVDGEFLMQMLDHSGILRKSGIFFALDPVAIQFQEYQTYHGGYKSGLREALLMWRWLTRTTGKSQEPIYLNDRQNEQNFHMDLLTNSLRAKLTGLIVRGTEAIKSDEASAGHIDIERVREAAARYILECEQHLSDQITSSDLHTDTLATGLNQNQHGWAKVRDYRKKILREPQLHVIDMSNLVVMARRLIPRKRARRPLMPKRSKQKLRNQDIEAANEVQSSARQSFLSLQLVVTLRQASNLPMRLVKPTRVPHSSRAGSPFLDLSRSISPSMSLSIQSNQTRVIQERLVAPTSYVELVFQRQQRATSLAQGRDPAWNETHFFQVDLNDQSDSHLSNDTGTSEHLKGASAWQRLADEYLQLNLYDYHTYELPVGLETERSIGDMSTLPIEPPVRSISSLALVSRRQKVERILLGQLRLPLAALVSGGGRIEGSFELDPPLLLDSHQFPSDQETLSNGLARGQNQEQGTSRVTLFVSLDPAVSVAQMLSSSWSLAQRLARKLVSSREDGQVLEYSRQWELILGRQPDQQVSRRRTRANHGQTWNLRHVRALVLVAESRGSKNQIVLSHWLACRLVRPIEAPLELVDHDEVTKKPLIETSKRRLARWVSLLRPVKGGLLQASLWFPAERLVSDLLGGSEEKALLLCGLFLNLGQAACLLLGDSLQTGRCVRVLVWPASNMNSQATADQTGAWNPVNFLSSLPILMRRVELWDPETGERSELVTGLSRGATTADPAHAAGGLLSVGSLITCENIYANVQPSTRPHDISFDIRSRSQWWPLFDGSLTATTAPLVMEKLARLNNEVSWSRRLARLDQWRRLIGRPMDLTDNLASPIKLNCHKLDSDQCRQLEATIERAIKTQLLRLRPDRPTYFNRTLSRILAAKMASFETRFDSGWRQELAELIREELLPVVAQSTGRRIVSWPRQTSFTSVAAILDALFASGLHSADLVEFPTGVNSPTGTQFLVACYVAPWPGRTLSVWLYVAALVAASN